MTAAGPRAGDSWTAPGAEVQLVVTDPSRLEPARDMLRDMLAGIDAVCGSDRPDSELALLDCQGTAVPVSPLLRDAIAEALRTARLTAGAVDPVAAGAGLGWLADPLDPLAAPAPPWRLVRLDSRAATVWLPPGAHLDLSAISAAWAADRCAAGLAAGLGCGVLVGLGGDIAVAGPAPVAGWRIRVQDAGPAAHGQPGAVVAIRDGGLSTSSRAARRRMTRENALHHLRDCRTGLPAAPYWRTVSVAAANCVFACAASLATMIRGRRGAEWLGALGLPARLVGLDGQVRTVGGWPAGS